MSRSWDEEEMELGYWHYFYELEKYFGETIVGRGVDTKGWAFDEYADRFVNQDLRFEIYLEKKWSKPFTNGVISAHKDFLGAIQKYRDENMIGSGYLVAE